jgi:hypothetical protein
MVLGTWIRRQIGGAVSMRVTFSWQMDGLGFAAGIKNIVYQVRLTKWPALSARTF